MGSRGTAALPMSFRVKRKKNNKCDNIDHFEIKVAIENICKYRN